jgi:LmbE family N-acetylglucosaminyl deacetylase
VPREGSSVLALGAESGPIAADLSARGHRVVAASEGRLPSTADPRFDLIVAVGVLERERWDRWALQKMHALLADGGRLLFSAANTLSARALVDPRYVAGKLAKQLAKLDRGRRSPPPEAGRTARTYTRKQLAAMLASLGYEVERWEGRGAGLLPDPLAPGHLVLCRRAPSLFGLEAARPFPDPAAHLASFEHAHRGFFEVRDGWSRRHPDVIRPASTALDIGALARRPILALAPHPDDELIGCGGTLLRSIRAGARVAVVQATDGSMSVSLLDEDAETRRTVRVEEAKAVARAAGFDPTWFWNADNGAFRAEPALVEQLARALSELRPACVFTPFVADIHPDHRTLNRILAAALATHRDPDLSVAQYAVWGMVPANVHCEVTSEMRELEGLLMLYDRAMEVDDYVHFCADRNYYNALRLVGGSGFVEGFLVTAPETFRALAADAGQASEPATSPVPGR